ncbi:MAG: flagellar motor protein MotB [Fimbriimonadaceae bacterium]
MSDGTPIIIKKVKARSSHAHHGGSWKVAYADFVTAMMAFFMVMWIMGLSDETRAQVAGYFNDPLGFKKNEPRSRSIVTPKSSPGSRPNRKQGTGASEGSAQSATKVKDADRLSYIKKKIKGAIASDKKLLGVMSNVEITMTPDGLRIELVESKDAAFFKSGSAVLNSTALRLIARIEPVLRQQNRDFIVEGHTDAVPYPSPTYTNWDLSSDRANALRRALFAAGLNEHLCVGMRALADTQLKVPSDPTSPRNRRVTILLPYKLDSPDGSSLPKDLQQGGPSAAMRDPVLVPHVRPG